jgi:hypothetical protein
MGRSTETQSRLQGRQGAFQPVHRPGRSRHLTLVDDFAQPPDGLGRLGALLPGEAALGHHFSKNRPSPKATLTAVLGVDTEARSLHPIDKVHSRNTVNSWRGL